MARIPYNKPALSYTDQLERLKNRGLIINDDNQALHILEHYGYYRLGVYWRQFQSDPVSHQFKSGTRFENILLRYDFDRSLRFIVLEAIERIEISVRVHWAHELGCRHGVHAHLDSSIFRSYSKWIENITSTIREVERSRSSETFIQNVADKYRELLPPIWVVCEVMSLGLLSRWYEIIEPISTRRAIADVYNLDEDILRSWLHHLTVIRNICAHHSRLWNRDFRRVLPKRPKRPTTLSREFLYDKTTNRCDPSIYNSMLILSHMTDQLDSNNDWRKRLVKLFSNHGNCVTEMGFPAGWKTKSIWQIK